MGKSKLSETVYRLTGYELTRSDAAEIEEAVYSLWRSETFAFLHREIESIEQAEEKGFFLESYGGGFVIASYCIDDNDAYIFFGKDLKANRQLIFELDNVFKSELEALRACDTLNMAISCMVSIMKIV